MIAGAGIEELTVVAAPPLPLVTLHMPSLRGAEVASNLYAGTAAWLPTTEEDILSWVVERARRASNDAGMRLARLTMRVLELARLTRDRARDSIARVVLFGKRKERQGRDGNRGITRAELHA